MRVFEVSLKLPTMDEEEEFADLDKWCTNLDVGTWAWSSRGSWINGLFYPNSVIFLHQEDALILKLKFGRLVWEVSERFHVALS